MLFPVPFKPDYMLQYRLVEKIPPPVKLHMTLLFNESGIFSAGDLATDHPSLRRYMRFLMVPYFPK